MIQIETQSTPVQGASPLQGKLESAGLFQGSFMDVLLPQDGELMLEELPSIDKIMNDFLQELQSFLQDLGLESSEPPTIENPQEFMAEMEALFQEDLSFSQFLEGLEEVLQEFSFSLEMPSETEGELLGADTITTESNKSIFVEMKQYSLQMQRDKLGDRVNVVYKQIRTLAVLEQKGDFKEEAIAVPDVAENKPKRVEDQPLPKEVNKNSENQLSSKFLSFEDAKKDSSNEFAEPEREPKKERKGSEKSFFVEAPQGKQDVIASFSSPKTIQIAALEAKGDVTPLAKSPTHPVVQQVVQKMEVMVQGGKQQMVLQLNPGHLGHVEIRIEMQDDQLTMKMKVENDQVKQILETNAPLLKETLEGQNVNLEKVEITSEQRFAKGQGKHGEQQQSPQATKEQKSGFEVEQEVVDEQGETGRRLGYNTMEFLA